MIECSELVLRKHNVNIVARKGVRSVTIQLRQPAQIITQVPELGAVIPETLLVDTSSPDVETVAAVVEVSQVQSEILHQAVGCFDLRSNEGDLVLCEFFVVYHAENIHRLQRLTY